MIPMIYTTDVTTSTAGDLGNFTFVLLAFLQVDAQGGLMLNSTPISPGSDPGLLAGIQALNQSFVTISIGGTASDGIYQNIINNYDTFLANLTALTSAYGIVGIDLDLEAESEPYSFYLQVCTQLVNDATAAGLIVTAPPYTSMSFWQDLVTNTSTADGPSIFSYNVQTYGGADYTSWVNGFQGIVPDPQLFLGSGYLSGQLTPAQVEQSLDDILASFPHSIWAFLWRYPNFVAPNTWADYANAIGGAGGCQTEARAEARKHVQAYRDRLARRVRKTA